MASHEVLVIYDSRGANLQELLEEQPDNSVINWTVKVYKGATLNTISSKLRGQHKKFGLIVVIAGICNFTTKTRVRTRNSIEYPQRKKEDTIKEIDKLLERYNNKIHLCTITPADLLKRKDHDSTVTEEDQTNLEQDISETNQYIITKNNERDFPTIDLAYNSYTKSIKKQGPKKKRITKFTSKDLPDGIHPSEDLKRDWARYIAQRTPQIIAKIEAKLDDESSDSDKEQESWRFKRQ